MKRIISIGLSLIMLLVSAVNMALPVAADSGKIKEYVHDGYVVEYNIVNEWTGNQNVRVTVTNTGDEEICGWAVKYETPGKISGIWNGTIVSEQENTYVISSSEYNSVIAKGAAATFGYTVSGENLSMPDEIILCNEWRKADESVEVSYEIIGDWGDTYQAEVSVSNNSAKDINCWNLSFIYSGKISRAWSGVLLSDLENKAVFRNNETTAKIKRGSKQTFSFIAEKKSKEEPELTDFVLYENFINTEKSLEEIELNIMGYADFSEKKLMINWYSTIDDGVFQILKSIDNEKYETICECENVLLYEYGKIDFDKAYFKVKQITADGRTAETAVIVVSREDGELNWEYLDTDEDGIPDIYEKEFGTDPNKTDTDDDGLTDYEEIYLTDTDPLVYNCFDEDLSDSDADSDSDGITNRKEIDIGTNPLNPDTDGDEIKLKLDPTASRRTDHTAYDIQRSGIYSKLSYTIFSAIGQNQRR